MAVTEAETGSISATTTRRPMVLHLLPYDGIGGAEIAARSLETGEHDGFVFRRYYLARHAGASDEPDVVHGPTASPNSPRAYIAALRYILREKPDLLIASLWRSALVLILAKALQPRLRAVIFLHCPQNVHFIDKIFTRMAMFISTEIWADSSETLRHRVPKSLTCKKQEISFVIEDIQPQSKSPTIGPEFIFWGRLHAQKHLPRALQIFARIADEWPDAHFAIIGPDGGEQVYLTRLVSELGLGRKVSFLGAMDRKAIFDEAKSASFYLQTSSNEGMAMSVVEAMQLGLVPIVTPVGEIRHYCCHGVSAIFVESDEQFVKDIRELITNPDRYHAMSTEARNVWKSKGIYRYDVLIRSKKILNI